MSRQHSGHSSHMHQPHSAHQSQYSHHPTHSSHVAHLHHSGHSQHSHLPQHSPQSPLSDDESDNAARSALEIRREKNRIKQRNLRQRRANQMAELERTVQALRNNSHDLEDRIAQLEAREASLAAWVRDLESALAANGQREHVESLRRIWAGPSSVTPDAHAQSAPRDSLATLATAAASSYRGQQRWEDDEAAASARKRRRQDDDYPPPPQPQSTSSRDMRQARDSHSPSRAMRIDQICLPLPRPSSQSPNIGSSSSEPWSWGHMSSLDHSAHSLHQYETKPRVALPPVDSYETKPRVTTSLPAPPGDRSNTPSEPRPMSSGSAGTSHTWNSGGVRSFEVRL